MSALRQDIKLEPPAQYNHPYDGPVVEGVILALFLAGPTEPVCSVPAPSFSPLGITKKEAGVYRLHGQYHGIDCR
jgi:hypothetical protein